MPPPAGDRLIVEPRYPYAAVFNRPVPEPDNGGWKIRNTFHCARWRCDIGVVEKDGKVEHVKFPAIHHLDQDMQTMASADVWGWDQERTALKLLKDLIPSHHFHRYQLTGMFLEKSRRSGLMYMFRRLKPTVVITDRDKQGRSADKIKILAALCMHPIGYYANSWAGAMCPTDDVIAHLMMMRGDEHRFWKVSNHFQAHRPEAGL